MSHFYGTLNGSHGQATRQGTKASGLTAIAASWEGCIITELYVDEQGRDCFVVYQDTWQGEGTKQNLASGIIGEMVSTPNDTPETQIKNLLQKGYHSNV